MATLAQEFQAGRYKIEIENGPNSKTKVDLGMTTGGVTVSGTKNIEWFGTDYSGGTEYEGIVIGGTAAISFELASTSKLNDMLVAGDVEGINKDFAVHCGKLASSLAYKITLTRVTGNNTLITAIATYAYLQGDIESILANALLTVPLSFKLLPDSDGKFITVAKAA